MSATETPAMTFRPTAVNLRGLKRLQSRGTVINHAVNRALDLFIPNALRNPKILATAKRSGSGSSVKAKSKVGR